MVGLGDAVGELFVKIVPDTSGFGAEVARATGQATAGIGGPAGKAIGTGMAAAAAAAFGKGITDFVDFERGMNEVFTLIPDAGQAAFDQLTEDTKAFASEFGVLPDEVIKPLYDSLSAGVPRENVFSFLEEANAFAKAGAVDLATSVDALTTGVNAFGLGAEGAGRVSDALFTAVKLGKTTVGELSASLFNVAPIAASFGVSVEDVSGAFATLTAQGTPTAVVATQLKGAISELGKEGTKASKIFVELAGKSFKDFIADGGSLIDVAAIMQEGAADLGLEMVDLFGSIEAGQAFVGLSADLDRSAANLLAVQEGAGATDAAFEQMEKGIGPSLDKVKARLAVAFLELGTTLAPVVEDVGAALADFLTIVSQIPGPILAMIVGAVGFAGALLALSGPILKTIQLIKGIGTAISALTKLLAANPYILLIAATIALAILIYKYWDEIVAFLKATWEKIKAVATVVWDAIKVAIVAVVDAISAALSATWNAITAATEATWNFIKSITETVWNAIKASFEAVLGAIKFVIETYVGIYLAIFTTAWESIKAVTQGVWDSIKSVISTTVDVIRGVFDLLMKPIEGLITIMQSLQTAATIAWDGIVNAVRKAWDALSGLFAQIRDAADKALGPVDEVLGAGARFVGSVIPGLASGGTARAGKPHFVGEEGVELFVPNRTGTVVPNDVLTSALAGVSGGGGQQLNFNFTGPITVRNDQDITRLSRALAEDARRTFRAEGKQVTA